MAFAETAIAVMGALGVGSTLGQYVTGARERRTARGDVLDALNLMERSRWEPHPRQEWEEAVRRFQAAALVARLPRDEVLEYLVLAQAARWASEEAVEDDPFSEGGIDGYLANAAREAAHAMSEVAWHSARLRPMRTARRRKRVRLAVAAIERPSAKSQVERSREYGVA